MGTRAPKLNSEPGSSPKVPFSSVGNQTAGKSGYRLQLTFSGMTVPVLERIDFYQPGVTEPNFVDRHHSRHPLRWTKVTQALTLVFLEYVEWAKAGRIGECCFTGACKGSLATALGNAIYKDTEEEFIHSLFSTATSEEDTFSLCKQIFICEKGYNVHGKDRDGKDRKIRVNENKLPPENVKILYPLADADGHHELSDLEGIRDLINIIRRRLLLPQKNWRRRGTIPESNYAKAIISRYGRVSLEQFIPDDGIYRELQLSRIFVPQHVRNCSGFLLSALEMSKMHYKELLATMAIHGGLEIQQSQLAYVKQPIQNILNVIENYSFRHVVILGHPGSGKSCLLQYLAVSWAESCDVENWENKTMPVLIDLRLFSEALRNDHSVQDFFDYLDHGSSSIWIFKKETLKAKVQIGDSLICFDGLDRILNESLREQVAESILRFSIEYPKARILVTSRLIEYNDEILRRAGFQHFMIDGFDNDQISLLSNNWFRETQQKTESEAGAYSAVEFLRVIFDSESLAEIASCPLLLTNLLVSTVNKYPPPSKIKLLEKTTNLVLTRWDVDGAVKAISTQVKDIPVINIYTKQIILRKLARKLLIAYQSTIALISTNVLEAYMADVVKSFVRTDRCFVGRAIIKSMRECGGLLCIDEPDRYTFLYRGLLDYACAEELRIEFESGKIFDDVGFKPKISARFQKVGSHEALCLFCGVYKSSDDKTFEYGKRWEDRHWYEVLLLFCGMLYHKKLSELLSVFLDYYDEIKNEENYHYVYFAAACVTCSEYLRLSGDPILNRIKQSLVILSFYQPPRLKPLLDISPNASKLASDDWNKRFDAILPCVAKARTTSQVHAVELLGLIFDDSDDIALHLIRIIRYHNDNSVRVAALKTLSQAWRCHPKIVDWLKKVNCDPQIDSERIRTVDKICRQTNFLSREENQKKVADAKPTPKISQLVKQELGAIQAWLKTSKRTPDCFYRSEEMFLKPWGFH